MLQKKVFDRKMRAIYECEYAKGKASPGFMITKSSRMWSGTYHGKLPCRAGRGDVPVFLLAGKAVE